MKYIKNIIFIIFIIAIFSLSIMDVKAHNSNLGIEGNNGITYDTCDPDEYMDFSDIGDGYNEKWYDLVNNNVMHHIDDDLITLYYKFYSNGRVDSNVTWSSDVGAINGEAVKAAFEQSMLKWNNVYYYKLNNDGIYEKHKIVNLVNYDSLSDTTGITPNIRIYPYHFAVDTPEDEMFAAETNPIDLSVVVLDSQFVNWTFHLHYTKFSMDVNVENMVVDDTIDYDFLDKTGAHEMGHVLGLRDIDEIENPGDSSNYHHEELLMGYAKDDGVNDQKNITYKDIAGVAITRGFHTNSDHIWLRVGNTSKVICSLCNAVIENATITTNNGVSTCMGCPVYAFEQCGHNINNLPTTLESTMIPVASYGNTDYYKCKYCRYVAPFTSRVAQNYSLYSKYDATSHILENNVTDLNYLVLEPHDYAIHIVGNIYKCSKCNEFTMGSNSYDTINLSCHSKNKVITKSINSNEAVLYKINIDCNTSYSFTSSASQQINMALYDENLNIISGIIPTMTDNNCTSTMTTNLSPGVYYLITNFVSTNNSGTISTSFRPTTYSDGVELYLDTNNNINTHIHKTLDGNYHTEGYYENTTGAGFYKITLTQGSNVYYPEGAIKIYEDNTHLYLIDKFKVTGMEREAVSKEGENVLYVFFPDICTYYFDITLPYSSYLSLILRIERSDINNLDYSNTLLYSSFNPLFENVNSRTYFEEVTISHRSKFRIEISSNDTLYNLIPFYVFKKEETTGYNPYYRYHNVQVSTSSFSLNTNHFSTTYIIILDAGTYYIGYENNILNKRLNCAIGRIVDYDASSLDPLVTDYATTEGFVLGSEVTFNGGLLQGTTITEGFTRCLYLMFEPGVEIPNSRLDYDWYSSNTNVATVSSYGTVLGLPVSNNTNVTIYAILREDPSVVYSINLTILNDTSVIPIEIESYMSYSYSTHNGTYQLALDSSNCPFPRISYYEYDIDVSTLYPDLVVSMNLWGYITSNGTGEATITGSYNLNSRVTLTIYLTITS